MREMENIKEKEGIVSLKMKEEDLKEFLREIERKKAVKAVYLFGSYVNGKMHIKSDIDVCVFCEENDNGNVGIYGNENVDVVYFNRLPITMKFRVLREGKEVFIRDKEFIKKIKLKTIREYFEFKPLLNKFLYRRFKCTI